MKMTFDCVNNGMSKESIGIVKGAWSSMHRGSIPLTMKGIVVAIFKQEPEESRNFVIHHMYVCIIINYQIAGYCWHFHAILIAEIKAMLTSKKEHSTCYAVTREAYECMRGNLQNYWLLMRNANVHETRRNDTVKYSARVHRATWYTLPYHINVTQVINLKKNKAFCM